jgi:hypothetical protein
MTDQAHSESTGVESSVPEVPDDRVMMLHSKGLEWIELPFRPRLLGGDGCDCVRVIVGLGEHAARWRLYPCRPCGEAIGRRGIEVLR